MTKKILKPLNTYIILAITAIGIVSPWWCSGHHSFTCRNGLGIPRVADDFPLVISKGSRFSLYSGILLLVLLAVVKWLENRKQMIIDSMPQLIKATTILILVIAIFTTIDVVLLVRDANQCEFFSSWTTFYINYLLPNDHSCEIKVTWITHTALGIWVTLGGAFLLAWNNHLSFARAL